MASFIERDQRTPFYTIPFIILKWVFIAPFVALSTAVIGSLIMVLCLFGAADFSSRVLGSFWARINSLVCMMGVKTIGRENIDPNQSYVIVANHQSLIDILVLYGHLNMDIKWVMKKELRQVPILGIACEMMGHILIDRSNTEAALGSINSARDKLHNGMCVIFFPEGTRSRNGELKPFKKGAFRLAQELGLPILPVAIHGTKDVLPSDTADLWPGNTTLEFLEPIAPAADNPEELARITKEAREQIHVALNKSTD